MKTAHPKAPFTRYLLDVVTGLCFICCDRFYQAYGAAPAILRGCFLSATALVLVFLLPAIGALRAAKLSRRQWRFLVFGRLHAIRGDLVVLPR